MGTVSREIPVQILSPLNEDETGFSVTTVLEKQAGRMHASTTQPSGPGSESGGDLIGTPVGKKAIAVATPAFAGCQVCSVETTMKTAGGTGNQVVLLGWYVDKKNTVELMMKQENGKWILKELSGGRTVAKGKGLATILPNVSYDAVVQFDGTQFIVTVDGTELLRMNPAAAVPVGTVGFQVKSTTAHFGEIIVN